MYELNNDRYYYLTLMNENYTHPSRPNGVTNKMIMQEHIHISKISPQN